MFLYTLTRRIKNICPSTALNSTLCIYSIILIIANKNICIYVHIYTIDSKSFSNQNQNVN